MTNGGAHNDDLYREVSTAEHPESPSRQPSLTLAESERQHRLFEQRPEHRSTVALVDAGDHDRELKVVELADADVDGIFEAVAEQEESSGKDCTVEAVSSCACAGVVAHVPASDSRKRCLLIKAKAFLDAAVRHRCCSKSFERNLSICR